MHLKSYELQNGTGVERNDDNLAMATHIAVLGLPFGKLKVNEIFYNTFGNVNESISFFMSIFTC